MTDSELKEMWRSYEQLLNESLVVNRRNAVEITRMKVSSQLVSMKPAKWLLIIAGILWCAFLIAVVVECVNRVASVPVLLFFASLALINAIGVGTYLHHLTLIHRIQSSQKILEAQGQLARLKASTLASARIFFLQIPFYFSIQMLITNTTDPVFWAISIMVSVASMIGTAWLILNINASNSDKKWFHLIFGDQEWNGIVRSIELLQQIEDLQRQNDAAVN